MDSLLARKDWEQLYVVRSAQLQNKVEEVNRYEALDELSRAQLVKCDSIVRHGFTKERSLLEENGALRRSKKAKSWLWGLSAVSLIVGVLIGK